MTHRYIGASALALALFPLATIQANQANELNPDVSVILDKPPVQAINRVAPVPPADVPHLE